MTNQALKQWDDLTEEEKDKFINYDEKQGIFFSVEKLFISRKELVENTIEEVLRYLYTKGYLKISN